MFLNVFKWFSATIPFPVWVLTLLLILLWWGLTWLIARLCLNSRIRSGKVIFSAQMVIFFVGAIFIFNLTLVPIVLMAFHGIALFTLGTCGMTALLYFLRLSGQDTGLEGTRTGRRKASRRSDPSDPFA